MNKPFESVAIVEGNPKYDNCIARQNKIYERKQDVRDPFSRDYTRILFSKGYRRLKKKTQVFFAPQNDHICTRSEHVQLVSSVAQTIGDALGLNTNLIRAIALGHDIGHSPYGHGGEKIIDEYYKQWNMGRFFHERHGLYAIDHLEILYDDTHHTSPLNLTYAIRDGIISHCGEVNQEAIKPRDLYIDLEKEFTYPGQYNPYTYEGCVVKMSDKIAYLSRDIEDAIDLKIISKEDVFNLVNDLHSVDKRITAVDNGTLIHYFIMDVVKNSTVQKGIALSKEAHEIMRRLMIFSAKRIYQAPRLSIYYDYVKFMIDTFVHILDDIYVSSATSHRRLESLLKEKEDVYPLLVSYFEEWLRLYAIKDLPDPSFKHKGIYRLDKHEDYRRAILDYIAGMTDEFMTQAFNEIVTIS